MYEENKQKSSSAISSFTEEKKRVIPGVDFTFHQGSKNEGRMAAGVKNETESSAVSSLRVLNSLCCCFLTG